MMKIANGLEILELITNNMGGSGVLCSTLIWDDSSAILVDAGLPGQLKNIREEMEKAGVPFRKLSKIIITHHDMDHIGSLSSVVKAADKKIEVLAHAEEKPYIQGEKRPIKMTPEREAQMEEQLNSMSEEKRNAMKEMYANIPTSVDRTVEDGEEVPDCGGIVVIYTPGHTPGHICLYLERYKTLITGDAMNVVDGQLHGPKPQFTFNMEEALGSLKKLAQYDVQRVICYHGGLFSDNANQRIAELANGK